MKKLSIKNLMKKNKKNGFTLVELIIVIAIIAVLVAIAIPKFGSITRNANIKADIATAKTIHGLAAAYIAEGNATVSDANIATKIDGAESSASVLPTTKATGGTFHIKFESSTGNIVITDTTDDGKEIYPKADEDYGVTNSTADTE